jgi:polysaccharide export outer membrane protein
MHHRTMDDHRMLHILYRLLLGLWLGGILLLLSPPGVMTAEYVIGAGDTLHISVWGNEQLNSTVLVRPDGKISFPLLNDLQASGLTPTQLRQTMTDKLQAYVRDPNVTVTVTAITSFNVFVEGEVASPGMHTLHQQMTLLHLIAMVGGVTDKADLTQAYLLRNNEKMPVDFYKLIKQGDLTQNLVLRPNDLIFIPDNFDRRVTVSGEVKAPQIIPYREGLTVLDVILQAGGFTEFAKRNNVRIVRHNGDHPDNIRVKLGDIMNKGLVDQNVRLQPGDLIVVPRSLF